MDTNALTETPGPPARPSGALPVGTSAAIVAVLALVFAAVALVVGGGDEDVATSQAVSVDLTEFAITPASVQVPAGGSLRITNSGSAAHNVTIRDTDIATAELAAGESEELDLSSIEPGVYELFCSIPGHAKSGMTGTLTVTEGDPAASGAATGDTSTMAGMDHSQHMTEADYQRMDEAMEETIASYPAETEGAGNQLMEPEVLGDGTKEFEISAAVTPWEVAPGQVVDAWTYNGMAPGPVMHVDVDDKVRIGGRPVMAAAAARRKETAMAVIDGRTWLEHLSSDECWRLLSETPVGRIGVLVDSAPEIYPVNHLVDGNTIVFRTAPGSKLRGLDRSPSVCYQIDGIDTHTHTHTGWSVLVKGRASPLRNAEEVQRVDNLPLRYWSVGAKAHWIRIVAHQVTGRRIWHGSGTPAGPAAPDEPDPPEP